MNWMEFLGYFSSLMIIVSLLMSSIVKLRWINLGGALLMVIYGVLIKAYPVLILNFILVLINAWHLYNLSSLKEKFKILKIEKNNPYYDYFFSYFEKTIKIDYPKFEKQKESSPFSFCVLRNLVTAGIYLCEGKDNILIVNVEFVIPEYRDCKVGSYVYHDSREFFSSLGYEFFHVRISSEKHKNYLESIGFMLSKSNPELMIKRVDL